MPSEACGVPVERDVHGYGFKRSADLIESVDSFRVERRESGPWVKRVR